MADFFSFLIAQFSLPSLPSTTPLISAKKPGNETFFEKKVILKKQSWQSQTEVPFHYFLKEKNLDPCCNISSHTSHSPDARLMCKLLHSTRNRATSISYGERALVRINWWHVLVLSASRLSTYLERKRIDMMQIIDKFSSCVNITEVSFGGAVVH